jgi:hypothetical protein
MKSSAYFQLGAMSAAMITSASVHASFTGITLEGYNTIINGNSRNVYRVYANFSSPNDGVSSIGPIGTPMTLHATLPNGQPGGSFFAGASPTPPSQTEIDNNPNAAHRSFYTINLTVQDQNPNPILFPLLNVTMPAITGNTVTAAQESGATTTTPNSPFALAGWGGQNRVLILQLQVTQGCCVKGTIGLNIISAGTEAVIVAMFPNLNGGGCIPLPGTLALLATAPLLNRRRRR